MPHFVLLHGGLWLLDEGIYILVVVLAALAVAFAVASLVQERRQRAMALVEVDEPAIGQN